MAISKEDRQKLLGLARSAVTAAVSNQPLPKAEPAEGILAERRGCFVTLTHHGSLRGCIGTFQPDRPLAETVVEMGAAAARDPRFVMQPITAAELPDLTVAVSVLSPLTPTDEPEKLTVGKHGIYIRRGYQAGCFLPEVATEMGWNAEQFLENCCVHKAGLPHDAWRQEGTTVYLFTSEKFQE